MDGLQEWRTRTYRIGWKGEKPLGRVKEKENNRTGWKGEKPLGRVKEKENNRTGWKDEKKLQDGLKRRRTIGLVGRKIR